MFTCEKQICADAVKNYQRSEELSGHAKNGAELAKAFENGDWKKYLECPPVWLQRTWARRTCASSS